jgi:hypothetical protein
MQTGVPVFQLRQEMIEGVNIRSHLTKAVADAYQPDQVYKQLRNIGANGEELSLWMRYVRSTKDGVKWDPSAVEIGPYKIPAFDPKSMGPEPAQEVKELLFKSRQMLDHVHEMQRSAGVDIGYLPGYVPIKKAYLESLGTGRVKRNKLNEPSFLQRRKRGEVSEEEAKRYELDFYNWMPSSVRGGIKSAAFPNMAEKVNAAYWHFKNAGRGQYADEFLKQVSTALGHKGSTETIEFIASEVAKQNSQWIGAATKIYEAHGKMPLGEDLHLGIQNVMYNLAIGLNPKTMLQQFMQPEWVGAAEIGLKWTEKGKALAFGGKLFSKESRAALERVKSRLYPEELDVALMGEPKGERRKSIELISQAMGMPGWPGMKLFAALDKKNRELMYLGAIEKWKWATKNGKLKETMEHLLEGEKSQILKAWERSGEQEAMDRFGLIVSKRSNYAYNLVEKGEFFQQGIGAKIPFVNFGVNQWMRHIEASRHFLKTKDPMPLAKLIAYGVGGAVAFQELTGQKFFPTKIPVPGGSLEMSSAIPQAAMFGMGTLSPLTAYTSVVGGRLFTPTRVKDQYERYLGKGKKEKKQKRDPNFIGIEGGFGFRPAKKKKR